MNARHQRSERQIEAACDRLVLEHRGRVVKFPRPRIDSDRSICIPSRRYHAHGLAFWWAPRSVRGRLSYACAQFLIDEYTCGLTVGAGDDAALRQVLGLAVQRHDSARGLAWEFAQQIAARGLFGNVLVNPLA